MANAYVFPGGKVDATDSDPSLWKQTRGMTPDQAATALGDVPPEVATGYYVAAIRETFEEAGVLLAAYRDSSQESPLSETTVQSLERHRLRLLEGNTDLLTVLQESNLVLTPDSLIYWDHWITPEVEERRYNARFFLAEIPAHFTAGHDSLETTDSGWFTPTAILERYRSDRLTLAPPTLRTLVELQELGSYEAVKRAARERVIDQPILPVAQKEESRFVLLLPGDKNYPGSNTQTLHRAEMIQGRWRLVRAEEDRL